MTLPGKSKQLSKAETTEKVSCFLYVNMGDATAYKDGLYICVLPNA